MARLNLQNLNKIVSNLTKIENNLRKYGKCALVEFESFVQEKTDLKPNRLSSVIIISMLQRSQEMTMKNVRIWYFR